MAMSGIFLLRRGLSANGIRNLWTTRILFTEHTENVNTQASNESDEAYEKNIKTNILNASLNYVNDLGWSQEAISAGAESIGYPGIIHGMFPNRGADLVYHFYSKCNKELNKILQERDEGIREVSEKEKKAFEQQLKNAVEIRLRMIVPYKKVWPQALGLMTLPKNVPMSLANLLTLVDDICYYSGDRSVDINWYTRRVVLAGIYKTTELYMLQDSSEDHTQTWHFLERRITDATHMNAILAATGETAFPAEAIGWTSETAKTVFRTVHNLQAHNILGLNWNR